MRANAAWHPAPGRAHAARPLRRAAPGPHRQSRPGQPRQQLASRSPRRSPGSSAIPSWSTSARAWATRSSATGPGIPVQIEPKDLEVHRRESLITVVDGHRHGHEPVDVQQRRLLRGEARRLRAEHADQDALPARLPAARGLLLLRDGAAAGAPAAVRLGGLERHEHRAGAGEVARAAEQEQVGQPPDHPDHGLAPAPHLGPLRRRRHDRGHAARRSSAARAAASASTPS